MNRRMIFVSAAAALVIGGWAMHARSQNDPAIRLVMKAKLGHAQAILEGLATEKFAQIEQNAAALGTLSRAADWNVHKTPEYVRFSEEFRRIADSLVQHAKAKKLEAATLDYMQLTLTCVNCHSHVRKIGVAQGDLPPSLDQLALDPLAVETH